MDIEFYIMIIIAGIALLIWFFSLFSTKKSVGNWHKQNMEQYINYLSSLGKNEKPWFWNKNK